MAMILVVIEDVMVDDDSGGHDDDDGHGGKDGSGGFDHAKDCYGGVVAIVSSCLP